MRLRRPALSGENALPASGERTLRLGICSGNILDPKTNCVRSTESFCTSSRLVTQTEAEDRTVVCPRLLLLTTTAHTTMYLVLVRPTDNGLPITKPISVCLSRNVVITFVVISTFSSAAGLVQVIAVLGVAKMRCRQQAFAYRTN
jgi:hypothetical protein